ncbi:alpha-D-xyloside xylohydrolase [Rhizomicrobium palustre]|uniref:Alpha-D-xyloside xylohydrolase n=1 Tax=Rhizomicrobium palustre TaxID=189966 RepID=A0A846N180_9PROT|nr:TIM-barrel domain-containing protein [Rhizomicrobium palustre]NIK88992.1 alpha-D-xyloside xylohydrolase [Rhizomicrobium palustre]
MGTADKTTQPIGQVADLTRRGTLQLCGAAVAAVSAEAKGRSPAGHGFSRDAAGSPLHITALSDRALRIQVGPFFKPSTILLSDKTIPFAAKEETAGEVVLRMKSISCRLNTETGRLSFFDGRGTRILAEGVRSLTPSKLQDQNTLIAEQGFVSPADERLFGTGQFQDGFLNLRGLSRRLTQVNTQISLPFLLSSKGYGLLWHNTGLMELNPRGTMLKPARVPFEGGSTTVSVTTTVGAAEIKRSLAAFECAFEVPESGRYGFLLDVGNAMASKYHVEIDGKVLVDFANFWLPPTTSFFADLARGAHKLRVVGDSKDAPWLSFGKVEDTTVLRSPVSEGVDYIVIAGPSAEDIIAEYRRLTGAAPMLPKWAYGYIHCRERYKSSEEILTNAKMFRARNIPMDVMVQDWQYWGKYGWNAMQFDEADYPDPAGMIGELHRIKARFMVSVWSKVDPSSDVGKALAKRNCYISGTTWIDFFNPDCAAAYWGAMSHKLVPLGIDAWWQDATEPENDDLAGRKTAAGPGEIVRLQYPIQVNRTVYEGLRRDAPDRRVMILSRCAFLGQQRYASATWSGDIGCDWETLRRQIPAGLNMMAAGYPYWTVDAGGFFRPGKSQYTDPAYHELFSRWLQFAAFLPLMRVHGYQTTTEPWHYGAEVEARTRATIELRYRLLPYIYSAAAAVTRKGSTLLRPLVLDFAQDPKALDQTTSFMFGKAIHVAPVLAAGVKSWSVYLPKNDGGWYDFWTGEHRDGGAEHDIAAPIDRIPLHVRAGGIVPLGPVVQSTAEADGRDLTIRVYPGADGRFELYEDEGTNYNYEKGAFATISFTWKNQSRELIISARKGRFPGMLERRSFHVAVAGQGEGKPVAYDGKEMRLQF